MEYAPINATTVDLTEGCNLNCEYCFTQHDNNVGRISWKMLRLITDWWLAQSDPTAYRMFQFWGGEPLLEWEKIVKTVEYLQRKTQGDSGGVEYGGTTNGVLYTPKRIDWCVANNASFLISLDGPQDIHDARRPLQKGGGSWKKVDEHVRYALKVFPRQKVRCSLSAKTAGRFLEIIKYFVEDLGISDVAFSPVFEDDWTEEDFEIMTEQFDLATDYAIERRKMGSPIMLKHLNDEASFLGKRERQNPCGAGNHYGCWSIDGFLYPCHRFNKHYQTTEDRAKSDLHIGRLTEDGEFTWTNDEWHKQFINFKDSKEHLDKCGECSIFEYSGCNGHCYATSFDLTGSIYEPDERQCRFAKIQQQAGRDYAAKAKALGWHVTHSNGARSKDDRSTGRSCTCYNMCYMEGTTEEILYIDSSSDVQCLCYNSNYSGPKEPQYRTANEIREERAAHARVVRAAIKVMGDYEDGNERQCDQGTNESDEHVLGEGTGKCCDPVQHAGTDECNGCCNKPDERGEGSEEKVEEE